MIWKNIYITVSLCYVPETDPHCKSTLLRFKRERSHWCLPKSGAKVIPEGGPCPPTERGERRCERGCHVLSVWPVIAFPPLVHAVGRFLSFPSKPSVCGLFTLRALICFQDVGLALGQVMKKRVRFSSPNFLTWPSFLAPTVFWSRPPLPLSFPSCCWQWTCSQSSTSLWTNCVLLPGPLGFYLLLPPWLSW